MRLFLSIFKWQGCQFQGCQFPMFAIFECFMHNIRLNWLENMILWLNLRFQCLGKLFWTIPDIQGCQFHPTELPSCLFIPDFSVLYIFFGSNWLQNIIFEGYVHVFDLEVSVDRIFRTALPLSANRVANLWFCHILVSYTHIQI